MSFITNIVENIKNFFISKPFELNVYSPCDGKLVDQKEIPDEGFSENYMGIGVGIDPSSSEVVAPMSGKLVVLFKTKHAYVVKDEKSNVSVMLHLGINTVNIPEEKKAFTTKLKQDDLVVANSPLCEMDLNVIKTEATSIISALLVQNENMEDKTIIFHKKKGNIKKGELILTIVKKPN